MERDRCAACGKRVAVKEGLIVPHYKHFTAFGHPRSLICKGSDCPPYKDKPNKVTT